MQHNNRFLTIFGKFVQFIFQIRYEKKFQKQFTVICNIKYYFYIDLTFRWTEHTLCIILRKLSIVYR